MSQAKDTLSPSIDAFLSMVSVEKGLAWNTVQAYGRDLAKLANYLQSRGISSWREVDATQIRSFISSLRASGLSSRTVARHGVTVRQLLSFLQAERHIKPLCCRAFRCRGRRTSCRKSFPPRTYENFWRNRMPRNRSAPVIGPCSRFSMQAGCASPN